MQVPVKPITLIVCLLAILGVTVGFACMKTGNNQDGSTPGASYVSTVSTAAGQNDSSALQYLALGDSYTIGESVDVSGRYPVQAVGLLRAINQHWADPQIIAMTGWTTGSLLQNLDQTPFTRTYQAVTLLIGVNNQFQGRSLTEYKSQFTELVQLSIRLAGNDPSHVIILSIPDYSVTPFAQGLNKSLIASQIDSFNAINLQVSQDYKLNYIDITGISRQAATDPTLVASDGLHFSAKEYAIWAQLMEPVMKTIGSGGKTL